MRVRKATTHDLSQLRDVYLETRRAFFEWLDGRTLALTDFDNDSDGEDIWVCDMPDGIVGFVSLWAADSFIHHLYVRPTHQRQGIGSGLLKVCLANTEGTATLKCVSQNTEALSFYLSQGWQYVSTGVSEDGEYQLLQLGEI